MWLSEVYKDHKKNADGRDVVANGVIAVCEGANMPSTLEASRYFIENKVVYGPAKAANAGGVATSGLEMTQNSIRLSWTSEEVDNKLKDIMVNIFKNIYEVAKDFNNEFDLDCFKLLPQCNFFDYIEDIAKKYDLEFTHYLGGNWHRLTKKEAREKAKNNGARALLKRALLKNGVE